MLRVAAGAIACVIGAASAAAAQSAPAPSGWELGISGAFAGPSSFGTSDANLLTPSGGNLTLFSAKNELGIGYGVELHITKPLSTRFLIEGSGTLLRSTLRSTITDDFEDAEDIELSESLSRFTVEGSAILIVSGGDTQAVFLRGGAGWMRELAGDGAFLEDGIVANAGAGWRSWLRDNGRRKLGVRIEGRAQLRKSGITLGADKIRFSPVVSGGLLIGF